MDPTNQSQPIVWFREARNSMLQNPRISHLSSFRMFKRSVDTEVLQGVFCCRKSAESTRRLCKIGTHIHTHTHTHTHAHVHTHTHTRTYTHIKSSQNWVCYPECGFMMLHCKDVTYLKMTHFKLLSFLDFQMNRWQRSVDKETRLSSCALAVAAQKANLCMCVCACMCVYACVCVCMCVYVCASV